MKLDPEVARLSTEEQVAYLETRDPDELEVHLTNVATQLVDYLPGQARVDGAHLADVAADLPLAARYVTLQRLHGYATALTAQELSDAQRYNTARALHTEAAMASQGLVAALYQKAV